MILVSSRLQAGDSRYIFSIVKRFECFMPTELVHFVVLRTKSGSFHMTERSAVVASRIHTKGMKHINVLTCCLYASVEHSL